ncbi:MAG: transglycosylase SLT domain-containing protein [Proteobacteria bacterium]|nr:transglycosylase SLT domain-containing protein [Pseudomonadota bacterium]
MVLQTAKATSVETNDLAEQREIFIRAEHALKNYDHANYVRLSQKITSYPLYPYLIFYELKQDIQHQTLNLHTFDKIKQFQTKFPDFPYNTVLDELWLAKLAKNKNWAQFIKDYHGKHNNELSCYYHLAQFHLTNETTHLHKASSFWLVGHAQPKGCEQLFSAWFKSGELSQQLIWDRFSLALEQKNDVLGKQLLKFMSSSQKMTAELWLKGAKDPKLLQSDNFLNANVPETYKIQIMANCLRRLAKQNAIEAFNWWQTHQNSFSFTEVQKNAIERDIGVYLCHQRHPLAKGWLEMLPNHTLDNTAIEWRIRLALLEMDWPNVLNLIDKLPQTLKNDNCWQYWKARALENIGKIEDAKIVYKQLAVARNYYGFVSSLRLKQPVSLQHRQSPISQAFMQKVAALGAIQRFTELNLLKRHAVARVEWFRALDKMNDKELIAAAKIAQKLNYPDLAIFTMAKADFKDDIPLRFPLVHQETIINNANKHNIDPAWVFGIARQESAFFNEAVSSKGARGLLQLLPSTAITLAKKHEIDYVTEFCLHKPDVNLPLGAAYLTQLKKQMHNHIVLATASYNAGPTRTQSWLPQKPLEADIWIETIPYKETRDYIKNVLTFTSIYRLQLGYPAALELMMKAIPAQRP